MATSDLATDIETAAGNPAAVTVDGEQVTSRPIQDLIEADRYLAAKRAAGKFHRGVYLTKVENPGADGE